MSGYHQSPPQGYNYGAPSYNNYGAPPPQQQYNYGAPPQTSTPYGAPPQTSSPFAAPSAPHGEKPQKPKYDMGGGYGSNPPAAPYGGSPPSAPYGSNPPSAPYGGSPPSAPYGSNPPSAPYGSSYPPPSAPYGSSYPPPSAQYGSPFASLVPSAFPPGTDPSIVACFQMADQDGSGLIDDKELQNVLSSYNERFSIRTVRLLMFHFTNTSVKKIGPKEFIAVFYSLQSWRSIFERFDRDRSGKIDSTELRDALLSLGFSVSPVILDLLVSKFDKSGGRNRAIEYDNFIECCLTVKGLTEKFKEKDTNYSGSATFNYESFMLTVLPFLIA